ncbi:14472_t:CDS:2 [Funneliformis caledonium]|uniref:14472_t:CDS:1 n=1 Tax=Funneliformis caledonium TaxID=1117310 RepID=A0A9N9DWP3_9GLOM|nr:14472_t:CDS:2 [Funneliformis caledonium]
MNLRSVLETKNDGHIKINDRNLLRLYEDRLIVTYTGLGGKENCAAIRVNHPIPKHFELFYFEVDIIDKGENGEIGIGFCTQAASLNKMPGLDESYRYGLKFIAGDTIGCCINFKNYTVFYTRNGVNLGIAFKKLKNALYPYIRMMSPGGSVGANFSDRKFKYTVMNDDDIYESLKKNWSEILNSYNDKILSLQINKFSDLIQSSEIKQNINLLKYRRKLYFVIGEYKLALTDFTKLLEFDANNTFALKYQGEIYYITELYDDGKYNHKLIKLNLPIFVY